MLSYVAVSHSPRVYYIHTPLYNVGNGRDEHTANKMDPEKLTIPSNSLLDQAVSFIWLPGSTKLLYTTQSLSPHSSCPYNWIEKNITMIKKIASTVAIVTSNRVSCDLIPPEMVRSIYSCENIFL